MARFCSAVDNVECSVFNSTATRTALPAKVFDDVPFTVDPTVAAVSAMTIDVAVVAVLPRGLFVDVEKAATRG